MASVFLYIPNIIGYFRLFIIIVCWMYFDKFYILIPLYLLQVGLDGVDGCVARKLNQCSSFGAWLDVFVDNVGRTILWTGIYRWGVFVACFEWSVFVCTHTLGSKWKETFGTAPLWVQKVMENGFRTSIGTYAITGLHGLPLYLYVYYHWEIIPLIGNLGHLLELPLLILLPARLLCVSVELWFMHTHIKQMIESEVLHHSASDIEILNTQDE